jgi:hypothetical protein
MALWGLAEPQRSLANGRRRISPPVRGGRLVYVVDLPVTH